MPKKSEAHNVSISEDFPTLEVVEPVPIGRFHVAINWYSNAHSFKDVVRAANPYLASATNVIMKLLICLLPLPEHSIRQLYSLVEDVLDIHQIDSDGTSGTYIFVRTWKTMRHDKILNKSQLSTTWSDIIGPMKSHRSIW